jgi:hypothetical protein
MCSGKNFIFGNRFVFNSRRYRIFIEENWKIVIRASIGIEKWIRFGSTDEAFHIIKCEWTMESNFVICSLPNITLVIIEWNNRGNDFLVLFSNKDFNLLFRKCRDTAICCSEINSKTDCVLRHMQREQRFSKNGYLDGFSKMDQIEIPKSDFSSNECISSLKRISEL